VSEIQRKKAHQTLIAQPKEGKIIMEQKLQRLNLNLDSLFPGKSIEICGQVVIIRPLNIEQLAVVSRTLKGYIDGLLAEGVTWETVQLPANMVKIAVTLLEQFPDVLETVSQIRKEDLLQLPIDVVVDILSTVVEANLDSKEKLEGNLNSLIKHLNLPTEEPTPVTPKKKVKQKLQKLSKN